MRTNVSTEIMPRAAAYYLLVLLERVQVTGRCLIADTNPALPGRTGGKTQKQNNQCHRQHSNPEPSEEN
jgi:hypothetical protein